MADRGQAWSSLNARLTELESLGGVIQLLEWDQQTMMPTGGAPHRGAQMAAVSSLMHSRLADPAVGRWLGQMDGENEPLRVAAVRNLRRDHERAVRVPAQLVAAIAQASNAGFGAWIRAREADDFSLFQPALERLVGLRQEEIACHGPAEHIYDHLLDQYDPGSTTAALKPMFARLRNELSAFLDSVADQPEPAALEGEWDVAGQKVLSDTVIDALGFRLSDGRLDDAEHPFTVGMGAGDVRLTTHLYPSDLLGGLTGTIHEAGHGMYEQGLPAAWAGTGVGQASGMGMHESQSRFWENIIGRSLPFFRWLAPQINARWPNSPVTPEGLFGHANRVKRSLIRIQADEATYNLHIIVRFELELALLEGTLAVADLPEAWNAAYSRVLGVTPASDAEGVLQDVHWSNGLFGYFPSYTIGNLYAASYRACMEQDIPDLWDQVEQGDFSAPLAWLREKIHSRGRMLDAPQIFTDAVGERDPVADLMGHLQRRLGGLYELA